MPYSEQVQHLLENEVKQYYGQIPKTYLAAADADELPELLQLGLKTFRTNAAENEDKRICCALIATEIGLPGLAQAHLMILQREMGWSAEDLKTLASGHFPARLNERQILFARLAKSLAVNPAKVDSDILKEVEQSGQSKETIAEIVLACSFVRYMATIVSVYEVRR